VRYNFSKCYYQALEKKQIKLTKVCFFHRFFWNNSLNECCKFINIVLLLILTSLTKVCYCLKVMIKLILWRMNFYF